MRNIIVLLSVMLLLTACTSKEEKALTQAYEKKRFYHHQLQKTEKVQLYDGLITKAVLTATYLNEQSKDKSYKPDEVFIVGISIDEEQIEGIEHEGYRLTLNGKPPKTIQPLEDDDPLLKDISFKSEWSYFYLVTFPYIPSKSFKLLFESELYGKGELHFAKVAKYMLSREVI